MLVERMRDEAIAADMAQRFRIGGGLDGDRQEERNERIGSDVKILRDGAIAAPRLDERGGLDPVFFENSPVGHATVLDAADPPYPSIESLTAQDLGRKLGAPDDIPPMLKPGPGLIDLLVAGAEDRLDLIGRQPPTRLLMRSPSGKRIPGNLKVACECAWSIALAPQ